MGHERRDFFAIDETYDNIVTNPPFNQHIEFIVHAKRVARRKIALLLPLNFLTGKTRHETLWEDRSFPLARVWILNRGVNFLTDDPFAERLMPSQFYCGWYVFEKEHEGPPAIHWIDSHSLISRALR